MRERLRVEIYFSKSEHTKFGFWEKYSYPIGSESKLKIYPSEHSYVLHESDIPFFIWQLVESFLF